jgi:hypothetical protein
VKPVWNSLLATTLHRLLYTVETVYRRIKKVLIPRTHLEYLKQSCCRCPCNRSLNYPQGQQAPLYHTDVNTGLSEHSQTSTLKMVKFLGNYKATFDRPVHLPRCIMLGLTAYKMLDHPGHWCLRGMSFLFGGVESARRYYVQVVFSKPAGWMLSSADVSQKALYPHYSSNTWPNLLRSVSLSVLSRACVLRYRPFCEYRCE